MKSNPNPVNKGVATKRPTTSSSTAKWVLQSQPEQKQLNKVPPAHQNDREPNYQTQTRHDDQNGSKPPSTTQHTSPTKTGTLKFMVSHPKSPKNRNNKKDSPRTPDKKSSSTFSTPKSSTSMSPEARLPARRRHQRPSEPVATAERSTNNRSK
uniref:Uncharacterized protein n=1 Tax=Ciona savignyi TaxID=51511 RepID=H2YW18_CIOSA